MIVAVLTDRRRVLSSKILGIFFHAGGEPDIFLVVFNDAGKSKSQTANDALVCFALNNKKRVADTH